LIQKRIELWGEVGRIFEIKRLKQGFNRVAEQGFEVRAVTASVGNTQNPESYIWVMPIPQKEFDGNSALDLTKDQNPMNDGV
ncbi:MAG: RagB/SusD family nutrient uptake outer membrane protein, partial [Bacteroidales bacterium]|nr:RagB/SusD family nutrient uptake outer membrane protein [Bacteroidales bacterium]